MFTISSGNNCRINCLSSVGAGSTLKKSHHITQFANIT
ncbi:hypothetical protein LTSEMIN_0688, partial [Salmonella enterica subsp. enterica serovar Minnesota str. A4-603]